MAEVPSPELLDALRELGVVSASGPLPPMVALSGGVSSEIWRIDADGAPLVAKRALPQLRVTGTWRAPVERTGFEVAWMRRAERIVPGVTPGLIAGDGRVAVMRYLPPADHPVWKQQLLAGRVEPATAAAVGARTAAVHAATAGHADVAAEFANADVFAALRLDPYLQATATVHQDLAPVLDAVREEYTANRRALVHGDVSPKNVLVGPAGPVLLDAECATWGDPAFDLGFCSTHLLLKCWWRPDLTAGYLAALDALVRSYRAGVTWEDPDQLAARCARLVAALALARVDGLSPVEYLEPDARDGVRAAARNLLADPPASLDKLAERWRAGVDEAVRS